MGNIQSKTLSIKRLDQIFTTCITPRESVRLRVAVFETIPSKDLYYPIEGAQVDVNFVDRKREQLSTNEEGFEFLSTVEPGEKIKLKAFAKGFHILQEEMEVTIQQDGTTDVIFFAMLPLRHNIAYGVWQKYNPWGEFAKLQTDDLNDFSVYPQQVEDFDGWLKMAKWGPEREDIFLSAIFNFHGNVLCQVCEEPMMDLGELQTFYKDQLIALGGNIISFLAVMCLGRMAEAEAKDRGDESALVLEDEEWCQKNRPKAKASLAVLEYKECWEVPVCCRNFCLFEDHPERDRISNFGKSYCLLMKDAEAEDVFDSEGVYRLTDLSVALFLEESTTPKGLVVLQSCNAGFEPSLARAFLLNGTPFVLGYIKPVLNVNAAIFIYPLYKKWIKERQSDPGAIPSIFKELLTHEEFTYFVLQTLPVLFCQDRTFMCFDLPAFKNSRVLQVKTYRFDERPYWIWKPSFLE